MSKTNRKKLQEQKVHEGVLDTFAKHAAAFAAGAGLRKGLDIFKGNKEAKEAFTDFVKDSERIQKSFSDRLKKMPKEKQDQVVDLQKKLDAYIKKTW